MILVCGPCSAESYPQLSLTAESLEGTDISFFRAGLWKPRTRPNLFEGVGNRGLQWLKDIKERFGYRICTEIATPQMAEKCLQCGFDGVWIGARTTQNPFLTEQIAEVLQGSDITVMVKNPLNPDVSLWLGAIERFEKQGIRNIFAIHRGFSLSYNMYRQSPLWRIPLELKRLRKDIPLLCDPSHIAGESKYVKEIALNAVTTGFDGLMIETHCNPQQALTDAKQQITPSELTQLLKELPSQVSQVSDKAGTELESLRHQINDVDDVILNALAERMRVAKKIAEIKKMENMSVFQPDRWNEVLTGMVQKAENLNLYPEFVKEIYEIIHQESVKEQNLIITKSIN